MNFDRMRALLLDQAIRGELVPQLSEDGVVERTGVESESGPFEIPESWKWCHMKDITQKIHYGFTASATETGNAKLLRITDIQDGCVNWNTVPFCEVPKNKMASYKLKENDVVIARTGGTIGKSFLLTGISEDAVFASYLIRLIPNTEIVDPRFLMVFLNSPEYWQQLKAMSKGTGQPNVNAKSLSTLLIPIPLIGEQNRIVAKLEEVFAEIDRAEMAYEELQTLAGVLRGQILQKAIRGKLVPQLSEDGVVEQIGPVPEEVPFTIPESWKWVTLESISSVISKGTTPKGVKSAYLPSGIGFVRVNNFGNGGRIDTSEMKFIDEKIHQGELKRSVLEADDVLVSIAGTLGRTIVVRESDLPLNVNQAVSFIRLHKNEANSLYVHLAISSPCIQKKLCSQVKVTAIPNLTLQIIRESVIPLPPLGEQIRIVAKAEELLKQVDALSAQ